MTDQGLARPDGRRLERGALRLSAAMPPLLPLPPPPQQQQLSLPLPGAGVGASEMLGEGPSQSRVWERGVGQEATRRLIGEDGVGGVGEVDEVGGELVQVRRDGGGRWGEEGRRDVGGGGGGGGVLQGGGGEQGDVAARVEELYIASLEGMLKVSRSLQGLGFRV